MDKKQHPSKELTFEWGRTAPEKISEEASSLDSKIVNVFLASSIIIGVITALVGQLQLNSTLIPFTIGTLCFVTILIKSLWALRAQWLYVGDNPYVLEEDYWELEQNEAKEKYWEYVKEDFKSNCRIVQAKGKTLRWIIPLLALELVSLIVWQFLISYLSV